jgi:hypothetical protein
MAKTTQETRNQRKQQRMRTKTVTDDYGNSVKVKVRPTYGTDNYGNQTGRKGASTSQTVGQKINRAYQQTAGRVRSAAGKAKLYDNTTGKLTRRGKIGVGVAGALALGGVGAAALRRRNEKKRQMQR